MIVSVKTNRIFEPLRQAKQRYIVMKGSAGSGKSVDTAQTYIIRLMSEKGRNLLCVRKAEATHRQSTFAELLSAISGMGVGHLWKSTTNPLMLKCFNGNTVVFRGVNNEGEREKLKSITFSQGKLTDVWIEEATELLQQDIEIIDDRLRGELPDGLFYQMRLTFNPVSAMHWIKKIYFDRADEDVLTHHSTYLDNRYIDDAYATRMMRRKEIDPEGYKIYGLGDWGETGGLILKNFEVKQFPTEDMYFDKKVYGQDFGFNHANAILDVGFKDGDLYICDEIYVFDKDTSEIIDLAAKKGLKNSQVMFCDSAEPDRIKMWRKAGYAAIAVVKNPNSVNAQIDYLKQQKIFIHPQCINTLKEINQWKWELDKKTNEYTDKPVNFMDDAMAALRYSIEEMRRHNQAKVENIKHSSIY